MTPRAPALSPAQRRLSILEAASVVAMAGPAGFTARAVAEAAGVAEGTIFRYFPSMDALLDAVICHVLDPTPTCAALRELQSPTLEQRVADMLSLQRGAMERVGRVFALAVADRPQAPRQHSHEQHHERLVRLQEAMAEALAPFEHELRFPLQTVVAQIHAAAFSASHPMFDMHVPDTVLVDILLHGLKDRA